MRARDRRRLRSALFSVVRPSIVGFATEAGEDVGGRGLACKERSARPCRPLGWSQWDRDQWAIVGRGPVPHTALSARRCLGRTTAAAGLGSREQHGGAIR
jgi:hypothetical protein